MDSDLKNRPDQDSEASPGVYDDKFNPHTPSIPLTQGERDSFDAIRQAEANPDSLFNPKGDQNTGSPKSALSPFDNGSLAGNAAGLTSAGLGAAEALGAGFNPIAGGVGTAGKVINTLFGSNRRKQASIGGALATLLVGAGFFGFTVASGPLEIIHYAQLMSRIHLTTNENQTEDRTGKIMRTIKNYKTNKVYKNNLGYLANKYGDRIETKLNKAGYESTFNDRTGAFEGLNINRESEEYKGKTDEQIRQQVKEKFGLDVKTRGVSTGRVQFYLDARDMGYVKGVVESRGLIKNILKTSGYSNTLAPLEARVTAKRYGITMHPIKRLDAKIIAAADEAIRAKLSKAQVEQAQVEAYNAAEAEKISNGVTTDITTKQDPKPTDPQSEQQRAAATDNASQVETEAAKTNADAKAAGQSLAEGKPGPLSKFTGSLSAKIIGGGAALVGLACVAKGLDDSASAIKQAQVIEPAMRIAGELRSQGSQAQSGSDENLKTLGYYRKSLHDPITGASILDGNSVKAEMGKPYNGDKVSATLKSIGDNSTPFSVLNTEPIKSFLTPVCSTAGQGIAIAISFLGGPIGAVVGIGLGVAMSPLVGDLAHWFAGKALSTDIVGPEKGDVINYGYKLLSNAEAVSNAGALQPLKSALELKQSEAIAYQHQMESQSFYKRTLDPMNQGSLFATVIDQGATLRAGGLLNFVDSMASASKYTTLFSSILGGRSSAATFSESYNYNIPTFAFSTAELDNADTSDPFANANAVSAILDQANGESQEYITRAHNCFGTNITNVVNPDGNTWNFTNDTAQKSNYYSTEYASLNCNDPSSNWLRVRFAITDTQVMKALACKEGDTESCTDLGFGADAGQSPSATYLRPNLTVASLLSK